MLTLENDVTLTCIDCVDINRAETVIKICQNYVNFKNVKLLTHEDTDYTHAVKIQKLSNLHDYSQFMIKDLKKYIETEFCLIVQYDGFILNPNAFDKIFFNFDYVGCAAEWSGSDINSIKANGGFSLRSKKLLHATSDLINDGFHPEDLVITSHRSDMLIKQYGINFAPLSISKKFGIERRTWNGQFGFHSFNTNLDNWRPGRYLSKGLYVK